jgi:hypothetical protein
LSAGGENVEPASIIESAVKGFELLKNAIELASKFQSKKKRIFDKYIEPGFSELNPVIEAYIQNMASLRLSVQLASTVDDVRNAFITYERNHVGEVIGREKILGRLVPALSSLSAYMEKHPRRKKEAKALSQFAHLVINFFSLRDMIRLLINRMSVK